MIVKIHKTFDSMFQVHVMQYVAPANAMSVLNPDPSDPFIDTAITLKNLASLK